MEPIGAEHLAECHFIEAEAALGAQCSLGELPLRRLEQEKVGDRAGEGHAAIENLRGVGAEAQLQPMAARDGAMQPFRQIPLCHQPAANMRVIHLQALDLVFRERGMIALQRFALEVKVRHGLIERQHADILEQRRQEYLFRQRLAHHVAESARRSGRQQRSPPIQAIAQAVGFAAAQGLDQGETQGKRQRGIQPEHHQGLAQILALAALGIQRRIGDAQNFRRRAPNPCSRPWRPLPISMSGS